MTCTPRITAEPLARLFGTQRHPEDRAVFCLAQPADWASTTPDVGRPNPSWSLRVVAGPHQPSTTREPDLAWAAGAPIRFAAPSRPNAGTPRVMVDSRVLRDIPGC